MPILSVLRRSFLPVALVVAVGLVVILARQNVEAQARLERVILRATRPRPGLYVPTVDLPRLGGGTVRVGETRPGARQLLIAFTTTCPYCRASHPAWRLIDSVRGTDPRLREVELLGLATDSTDSLPSYVANAALHFPVAALTGKSLTFYRLSMVPAVMLLDARGRTLYYRAGVLTPGPAVDSILAAMRDTATVEARPGPAPDR